MRETDANLKTKAVEENAPTCTTTQQNATPVYRSQDLLKGKREMFILHENEVYHLIRTKNNKLILQK